jgi:methyl-accepting chemotaxis protein
MVGQLSGGVGQIPGNSQAVAHDAEETLGAARTGVEVVHKTVNGMRVIKQTVSASASRVKQLGEHSGQIGMIIETIDDIVEQTNLLALNAAIEAARAGDHGKGFAVVADEVRKLAERSGKATKEIVSLIATVQHGTMEAVKAMEQGAAEVETGVSLAENAGTALSSILKAAEVTRNQVEQIAAAAKQMSSATSQVVKSIDDVARIVEQNTSATREMTGGAEQVNRAIEQIAAISEENSAAAEEVNASTEEMSAQMEQITAHCRNLEQMSRDLLATFAHFKLTKEGPAVGQEQGVAFRRRQDDWEKPEVRARSRTA